jgi:hypothetical protein
MKRLFLIGLLILVLCGQASAWGIYYKQLTGAGDNQEVLAVDADSYCRLMNVYVVNDGATTSTVTIHFEGTAGAYNRLIGAISLAAGEGVILDLPAVRPVTGPKGADIDADISDATTINIMLVYEISGHR